MTEFAVTGYAGTSTEAIARRSGVSQPYLFQLFGTKKDLFIAAVRHGFGRTITAFEAAGRAARKDDPSTEHVLDAMGRPTASCSRTASCSCASSRPTPPAATPDIRRPSARSGRACTGWSATCPAPASHELEHWFGKGMLMNTAAAIGPEMAEIGVYSFAELGRIAAIR